MPEPHDPNEKLFAPKAKKYWGLVTGGMILLGLVNLVIGYWMWKTSPRSYDDEKPPEAYIDASVPDDGKR